MSDYEKGVKEGIRFAMEQFMGCLPVNVVAQLYAKTHDFLMDEWRKEQKELDNQNV